VERLQINEILARILFDEYLRDMSDVVRLTPEELNKITSISVEDCTRIIERAKKAVEERETTEKAAEAKPSGDADAPRETDAAGVAVETPGSVDSMKEESQ
jgi:hypothetical protein